MVRIPSSVEALLNWGGTTTLTTPGVVPETGTYTSPCRLYTVARSRSPVALSDSLPRGTDTRFHRVGVVQLA